MDEQQIKSFKVYSNQLQIMMSPYDFAFTFHEHTNMGIVDQGTVTMSPQHAKVFAAILAENVKQYEALFGMIPDVNPQRLEELQKQGVLKEVLSNGQ